MDKLEPGRIFEKRFEIIDFLGGGGMGSVYKAKQLDANRVVALKLLHPSLVETEEFRKRFLRECKLLSQLESEHIITFYHAAISEDGYPYAVFEFLEGQTLRQLLGAVDRLSVPESLHILQQVCEAMQAAHTLNIIHRDLKPENIMMSKRADSWWIKIFDFGLSRDSIAEERESQKLTLTGDIVGTAAYMSPEQGRGERADERSDIYALGCIAYECLSGKQLFEMENPMAALHMHMVEDPTEELNKLCSFCPPALTEVLSSMLAKSPASRPRSMSAVNESLQKAESQIQQGISSSKARDTKRSLRLILIGVAALFFIGIGGFFLNSMHEQDIAKAKKEEIKNRAKLAELEERNFLLGEEYCETAGQAIVTNNFPEAIEYAKKVLALKNDTCAFVALRLRALQILTQASDFSGLSPSDPPMQQWGLLLRESEKRHCLSEAEQSKWMFSYYILSGNVHANKGRLQQTINASLEFEKLHNQVPEDQRQPRQFILSLVSRGHAYRNTRQYKKAFETDKRALQLARELEQAGAGEMQSVYPSVLIDCCVLNEDPKTVAEHTRGYTEAFESALSTANYEGMLRQVLDIQNYLLSNPRYVEGTTPLIEKTWKGAEMFPELSTVLRLKALQQYLHLKLRQAKGGKIDSQTLREIAANYLLILKQAKTHSLGREYKTIRQELAQELQALLTADGKANAAEKIKTACESFHLDD